MENNKDKENKMTEKTNDLDFICEHVRHDTRFIPRLDFYFCGKPDEYCKDHFNFANMKLCGLCYDEDKYGRKYAKKEEGR